MNQKELAEKLGVSSKTLYKLLQRPDLKKELLDAGRPHRHAKVILPKEEEIIKKHLGDYGKKN